MPREPDGAAPDPAQVDGDAPADTELQVPEPATPSRDQEPPVVARLVVEIRSDGRRTIARGVMEDAVHGERVAVEARGDSPISLALALARSIMKAPGLAGGSALRRLLGRPRRR